MSPLLRARAEYHEFPHLGEAGIDTFLEGCADAAVHALLFFPGDPAQIPETNDVAVVFPELAETFRGRLRGAVIAHPASETLRARFGVSALPCLVVVRDGGLIGSIPRIRDWSEYVAMITAFLNPKTRPVQPPQPVQTLARQGVSA